MGMYSARPAYTNRGSAVRRDDAMADSYVSIDVPSGNILDKADELILTSNGNQCRNLQGYITLWPCDPITLERALGPQTCWG